MKTLGPVLLAILLAAACGRRDDSPAPTTSAQAPNPPVAAVPQKPPPSNRVTTEDWLAQPIAKDPTAYNLPLEIELSVPELPPKELMEPSKELPKEE